MFIRSRLLLLVLAWALPALAALLVVVYLTARGEQDANERTLRDTSRAMAMVVEGELDRRAVIARVLSTARALQQLPELSEADAEWFRFQAREAMAGLEGYVEVRTEQGVVLDTRAQAAPSSPSAPSSRQALRSAPHTGVLTTEGGPPRTLISHPVVRGGEIIGNVVVTLLPSELQRLVDAQRLPEGWIVTVTDSRHVVVARRPGGASLLGRTLPPEQERALAAAPEGAFDSTSIDEREVRFFYSSSPSGWTYLTGMPRSQFGGYLEGATAQISVGAALLLLLAVAGALWVSRGIAGAVVGLKQMAARLSAGQPVEAQATGITECDDVAATLAQASRQTRSARDELERQVADAVERTREVERQASRSQRVAALGRLTGGVAHDFNNLLGVVSNSAHLVQRHAATLPQLAAPVGAILRAVDLGSRLTQQLMRFAGRRPLRALPLNLAAWVGEVEPLLQQVVGKRIAVSIEVDAGLPPIVVDAGELELALINLALNARDSMPQGGTLRVRARRAEPSERGERADSAPWIAIDVIDSGVGMPPEVASRVFEPFFTTKPVGEGTGLGLAQVHGFCAQAGGAARVSSAPGEGTRVSLLLPAAAAEAAPPPGPARRTPAADSLAGLRIVVVEDNEALGVATAALLRSFGAEVHAVRDAGSALDAVEGGMPVDVVLSDVTMPGPMDGVALGQRLHERRPPVPVVLTSGYAPQVEALQSFAFVQKPAGEAALVEALRGAVGRGDS